MLGSIGAWDGKNWSEADGLRKDPRISPIHLLVAFVFDSSLPLCGHPGTLASLCGVERASHSSNHSGGVAAVTSHRDGWPYKTSQWM